MEIQIKKTIEKNYIAYLDEHQARSVIAYAKVNDCDLQTAILELISQGYIERGDYIEETTDLDVGNIEFSEREKEILNIILPCKDEDDD